MIKMNLTQIKTDMILSEDIFDCDGKLVIAKGDYITSSLIKKLSMLGISEITVKDNTVTPLNFDQRNSFIEILSNSFKNYSLLDTKIFDRIRLPMSGVIAKIIIDDYAIETLICLKNIDNYTYNHSIHVGMLSGLIASLMEYPNKVVESCIIAGLYHDIGKLNIDKNILIKPDKLTKEEYDIIKTHPMLAMGYLDTYSFIDDTIKSAVLEHHERCDGKGYPRGISGNQISLIARVVAVADEYDAAISNKPYKKGISPFKASDELFADSHNALDPIISQTLIQFLQNRHVDTKEKLNADGQGEVVYINQREPNPSLMKIKSDNIYDLSTELA